MRKNEYSELSQFTSQYIGQWAPSENHWFGLDFSYHGSEYRFHTGEMYENKNVLPDGRPILFGLYKKVVFPQKGQRDYILLGEYATMNEVLHSNVIENRPFQDVIMDDDTELLGQD